MPYLGFGLVAVSTVVYGSTPSLVSKFKGDLLVTDLIAVRSVIAAGLLACLFQLTRPREAPRARARVRGAGVLLGLCFLGPEVMLFYASFQYIDTGVAVALGFVYPTFVLLIVSAREGRLPRLGDALLCALAVGGILLLTLPGADRAVSLAGVALVLTSAVLYASYAVIAGELSGRCHPAVLGVHVMFGVSLAAVVVGLARGGLALPDSADEWSLVLTQAVLVVVAISCYYAGIRRLGATRASFIDTAQPLVAVMMGALLLGERVLPMQAAGIGVILCSIAAFSWLTHRRSVVPFVDPP